MKNRLCKSVPNKFVSVSENVDVSDVVQTGVDCIKDLFIQILDWSKLKAFADHILKSI